MEESSTQETSHHCVVPDWNLPTRHQGQSLTHVQFQPGLYTTTPPFHYPPQMHIAKEIGAMHWPDANTIHLLPPMPMAPPVKLKWGSCDTLESIVRQATRHDVGPSKPEDDPQSRLRSCTENHRKATRIPGTIPPSLVTMRKRSRTSEPVLRRKNACLSSGTCGSGSSTFNMREDDSNTMMTTKLTEEDDASEDESGSKDEEAEARGGTGRTSRYSRQSKTAATTTHNLSERRRRDRINEKMKALQNLVPNSNKTDKASMLDEVIVYMKQLQAQVEMMKIMRGSSATTPDDNVNVPQMMNVMMTMPPPAALPPQQQLQMSLLTRMGVGLGLGMLGHANGNTANNAFVAPTVPQPHLPPHFLMPQMIPAATFTAGHLNPNVSGPLASMPMHDPYAAFLARKISMDNYYNKLAALHQQRVPHHPISSDKTQRQ